MTRVLLVCLALALPAAAHAGGWQATGELTAADRSEIRAVIQRQIEALKRDDARSAFALVSPAVQEAFGTPERFLDLVQPAKTIPT